MRRMSIITWSGGIAASIVVGGCTVMGAEQSHILAPVTVLGRELDRGLLPGAVAVVTEEEIQQLQPRSTEGRSTPFRARRTGSVVSAIFQYVLDLRDPADRVGG